MKIAYFWMTQKGHELTCRLQKAMGGIIEPKAEFPKTVQRDFQDCDALVFVMAMGIVVRTIAPLIRSKDKDPAVIVLDQNGTFAISLLSAIWRCKLPDQAHCRCHSGAAGHYHSNGCAGRALF